MITAGISRMMMKKKIGISVVTFARGNRTR